MSGIDIHGYGWDTRKKPGMLGKRTRTIAFGLLLLLSVSVSGCAATTKAGVVQTVKMHEVAQPPARQLFPDTGGPKIVVPRPQVFERTGTVLVKMDDGTLIECKNAFAELAVGNRVTVRETSSGDWAVSTVIP